MKNLIKHVQNMNALHHMWTDFDTIILGVSGGPDSMCLLHVMREIARKEQLSLIIAHVNYGLRGDAADADQSFVEQVARESDLPCEVLRINEDDRGSNEVSWRMARYDFFESLRKKYHAQEIAVAHNQNDQAETFLLHLLRGSGLTGLVGMRFVSCNHVVRPLLSVMRDEILSYCAVHNIAYCIDSTNTDVRFTRNRIRTELLPHLEKKYNPQIITTLARTAEMMAADAKILECQVPIFWKELKKGAMVTFRIKDFQSQEVAMQRRALLRIIITLCGHTKNIEKGFIDEMRKAILSHKNKNQIFTGKNLKMTRKGDTVICARNA